MYCVVDTDGKRWFAFSKIGFCAGTKGFEEALNAVKFLGWLKKFGPPQNILGPVKGQGNRLAAARESWMYLLKSSQCLLNVCIWFRKIFYVVLCRSKDWKRQVKNKISISVNLQVETFYLVRDINSPIYFHQSMNTFLVKFGVMIILVMVWNAFWCPLKI